MSWLGIEHHDEIVTRFRTALSRGRLASSFLFVGPRGIGKRTFAIRLAQSMLCETRPAQALDPCRRCASCQQVEADTHPDLQQVAMPAGKTQLPLELLIGDAQHRMREGLCARMAMKPKLGGHRIGIIDDADELGIAGANCLLKTLEEPPPHSLLILLGTSPQRQPPTIRSRCQLVRFGPLPAELIKRLVLEHQIASDELHAERISQMAEGSLERAAQIADEQFWEFRETFYQALANPSWSGLEVAKVVSQFVSDGGKDAAPRRERQRIAIAFATRFYREVARRQVGLDPSSTFEREDPVGALVGQWRHGPTAAAAAVDRCLLAAECVDANANQNTNIESWLDDLAMISLKGHCPVSEVAEIF